MSARGPSTDPHVTRGTSPGSPPAQRAHRSRWKDPRLAVGIALVAVCALLGARFLGGADDTVGVWAARGALESGQGVAASDLVRRQVGFGDQSDADAYLSADAALPDGATLSRAVGPGELVPRAALGDSGTGPLTEVPLSVETEAVPSNLRVGTVVDVWVTPDAGVTAADGSDGTARRSVLVFDDVAVLSVPRTSTSLGPTATRQVIIGVDEDQQGRLPTSLAALAAGTVVLTAQR
ncbi:MAG: hypothetical protein ABIQ59_01105 [Nocardioidaceae bacterium]